MVSPHVFIPLAKPGQSIVSGYRPKKGIKLPRLK